MAKKLKVTLVRSGVNRLLAQKQTIERLAAFMAKEAGTRLGEDTEQLHDMRVASRRLRAALGAANAPAGSFWESSI